MNLKWELKLGQALLLLPFRKAEMNLKWELKFVKFSYDYIPLTPDESQMRIEIIFSIMYSYSLIFLDESQMRIEI